MSKQIIKLFEKHGFTHCSECEGLFFTIPLSDYERERVKQVHGFNHFTPNGNRGVYVAKGDKYKYVTSDIKGKFRKYKGRNTFEDRCLNIFTYGDGTRLDNVKKWLFNYENHIYNTMSTMD